MRPTPVHVAIEAGESLLGYMTRVAAANNYDNAGWLLDGHPTKWFYDTSTWSGAMIVQVAEITGTSYGEIERRVYRALPNDGRLYFGNQLPKKLLVPTKTKSRRRYCPKCLESGIHHAVFDLVLVSACPVHNCRTSDRCPSCDKTVLWQGTLLFHCNNCGYDLRRTSTEDVDQSTLEGLRVFISLAGLDHGTPSKASLPAPLAHLTFGEAAELALGLASYIDAEPLYSTSFLDFSEKERARIHTDLTIGWNIIRDWPSRLPDFFEQYQALVGTSDVVYGAERAFRRFYMQLREAQSEPWLSVRLAFTDYLETRWTGNAKSRRHPSTKTQPITFKTRSASLSETAAILGLTRDKVKQLIKIGLLDAEKAGDFLGAPHFVTRASIKKMAPDGQKPIRLDQMGAKLGLSRQRQRQLVDEGVLKPALGPKIDGSKMHLFRARDVEEILSDIKAHMEARPDVKRTSSFSNILKGAQKRGYGVAPIIAAMRSGRLPALNHNGEVGLLGYQFGFSESRKVLTELEAENGNRAAIHMSLPLVGRSLSVPTQTAATLVAADYLAAVTINGNCKVLRRSLNEFCKVYVLTSQAAKSYGTSPRWFRHAMIERGIVPIDIGDRRPTSIFKRADLPPTL